MDMSQSNLEDIRPWTGSAQRRDKDAQRGESGWDGGRRVLESLMAQRHSEPLLEGMTYPIVGSGGLLKERPTHFNNMLCRFVTVITVTRGGRIKYNPKIILSIKMKIIY